VSHLIRLSILLVSLAAAASAEAADIRQVMTEYQANPAAFKDKYFGKTISVSGAVSAVYSDYVSLGDPRLFVVNCEAANPAQLRSLTTGAQVTVTGTVYNMLAGTGVGLRPCSVQ
jgi:hypothetical protein